MSPKDNSSKLNACPFQLACVVSTIIDCLKKTEYLYKK